MSQAPAETASLGKHTGPCSICASLLDVKLQLRSCPVQTGSSTLNSAFCISEAGQHQHCVVSALMA